MYSPNNTRENIMIKMRKKNYIQERKTNFNMDEEINHIVSGGGASSTFEKLWRGKTESFMYKTSPEKNFYLKEVMKKFQTNQDEMKGYNYKYVLELSDLLGGKDKDFSKKRLQLYNHRIEKEKKQYSKTQGKFIKYQKAYKPKQQTNYFLEYFDNRKKNNFMINHKGNMDNTFTNTINSNKEKNNFNQKEVGTYYKTTYNYNSPNKIGELKYLLNDKTSKKYNNTEKKYNNIMTEISNKKNDQEEQSFDTTSLVGKEDFLASGDKERYHEYLSREYNFFNQARLRQMKYIFDKQKRIKLFKKLPNAKFLNYKKENPLRIELFNKINREKQQLSNEFPYLIDKKLYLKTKRNAPGKKSRIKFNKDCQNMLIKLKKKFGIE